MPLSEFEHNLPACSIEPQQSTLPRAPNIDSDMYNLDPGASKL
jgi:hypothetical protein